MRRRPPSITAVVSLLFAAASLALLASMAAYLHFTLRGELRQSDTEELHGKLALLRELVAARPDAASVAAEGWRLRDVLTGHDRMQLVIRQPGGEVLYAYPAAALPGSETVPAKAHVPTMLRDESGASYQVLAATVRPRAAAAPELRIELAMNEGPYAALLRKFRARLLVAVAVGTLLAAVLGWGAVRVGMLPVRRIAHIAREISVERLGERIDSATAPRELQELVLAFNGMLERLASNFRRLEDFSSDLAHELRTPLNNMMLHTEVALTRARTQEEYARVLESNHEECERLSRMVSDMLFLAKVDAHELLADAGAVSLRSECEKVAEFFQPVLDENGVEVSIEGEADVRGDPLLLRRAITNLLSNAVHYTPRGQRITVSISAGPGIGPRLEVRNPGPGISPEHLGRVFDRFFRADPSRGHSQEGSGLGLAIVAAIMALHHGSAAAESTPGVITTFRLQFPAPGRSA